MDSVDLNDNPTNLELATSGPTDGMADPTIRLDLHVEVGLQPLLAELQDLTDKSLVHDGRIKVGSFMMGESSCTEFVELLEQLILATTNSYNSEWKYSVRY